jgi:putative salt-induced outer membrane protein
MRTTHQLSLLAFCVAVPTAYAQTKPDGLWRGTAGAGLNITSGNTDTRAVNLSVDMASATATDKISLGGNVNYGSSKVAGLSTTTANKWAGTGQYDYNLNPKMFVFGKLGLEGDNLKGVDLKLRTTAAGGVGYKLVDSKQSTFTLFGGAGYSTDKYDISKTIGGKTAKSFNRASLFLAEESQHVLSSTTSFKQRLEVYPGLSGDKAQILKFSAGLNVVMSSAMSLNVGLTNNYNSKAATGTKKNDLGFVTGINMRLGAN